MDEKPILRYTGYEQDGFEFWPAIRGVLRPLGRYIDCVAIEREVVDKIWWNNIAKVKEILEKYFVLELIDGAKKPRKKHEYTEEERKAIGERLKKGRGSCL